MKEMPPSYYDGKFKQIDPKKYEKYVTLWAKVSSCLSKRNVKTVLDVGCGPGRLGKLLQKEGFDYSGFDFSPVGVAICKDHGLNVWEGNALDEEHYKQQYDAYVSTEVLEHIIDDRKVVQNIPPGALFVFSVPTFMCKSHVRCFKNAKEIEARYSDLVSFERIKKIGKRFLVIARRNEA